MDVLDDLLNLKSEYAAPNPMPYADPPPENAPADGKDGIIAQKERELRPIRWRMEELRIQFMHDTTEFAAKKYEEIARQYVIKYPEVTLSLSKDQVAAMKAQVSALQADAEKIVRAAFADPAIWWHLEPALHDTSQYEQLGNDRVGNKYPAKVDKPVRRALGELGKVLEQYWFNVTTRRSQKRAFPEFWFHVPENELLPTEPYYPHLLDWSDEMQYTMQKYNTQYKKALPIYAEIVKLKEEKKKQQASQLWDST